MLITEALEEIKQLRTLLHNRNSRLEDARQWATMIQYGIPEDSDKMWKRLNDALYGIRKEDLE